MARKKNVSAPTNETVGRINETVMRQAEGVFVEYLSADTEQITSYPVDNYLELLDECLPTSLVGVSILLMRYLVGPI